MARRSHAYRLGIALFVIVLVAGLWPGGGVVLAQEEADSTIEETSAEQFSKASVQEGIDPLVATMAVLDGEFPLQRIVQVSAGDYHTCAVTEEGGVICWGDNEDGQLGDGKSIDRPIPGYVTGLSSGLYAISAGGLHTCALTVSGGVKCWGNNSFGQLGDGTTNSRSTPVDVIGLSSGVSAISAGEGHTCALTVSGSIKCWGSNSFGHLGDGTTTARTTPVDVVGLSSGISAISTGSDHTCALTVNGSIKCWGSNDSGQLGDGTKTARTTPVDVVGLSSGVSAISAGMKYTCALVSGGVKCWGTSSFGLLGNGTTTNQTTPVDVIGLSNGISAITTGDAHACALMVIGSVKCWGSNASGQLGDGSWNSHWNATPVDVVGFGSGVSAISAGGSHTCALTVGGGVKCWGSNGSGQLGDGTMTARTVPAHVIGLSSGVSAISAGGSHTCALTVGGGVKCWGSNGSGQLGDGTTTARTTPVDVIGLSSGVSAISAGGNHTCALTMSGDVKCWGSNSYGQLGDGIPNDRQTIPVNLVENRTVSAISAGGFHTCALTTSGGVICWGWNRNGQLGDGTSVERSTPVDVVGLSSAITAISASGNTTCALTLGGGVKCWGYNFYGQLGNGMTGSRSTPVDVVGLSSGITAISASGYHTCALTVSGGVKCWGSNSSGQLGDGTTTNQMTPVDAVVLSIGVYAIFASGGYTCVLTVSGGVKCWGYNYSGQLGDGTTTARTTPVDVIGLSSGVSAISAGGSHTCALTVNGGVMCWGDSNVGGSSLLPVSTLDGCYILMLDYQGAGDPLVALPLKSSHCGADSRYAAGQLVRLSANPRSAWRVDGWLGTDNDASRALTNTLTMSAADHTAEVTYVNICYKLGITHTGTGDDPVANPPQSPNCETGHYIVDGQNITVRANPAPGWRVTSWEGTSNDASSSVNNTFTMPAADHAVKVNYSPICYNLTLEHVGSGANPTASPTRSNGCAVGQYVADAVISLQAAPATGHTVSAWTGTSNDAGTATTNTLTMPAAEHTVKVTYGAICYKLIRSHTGTGEDPLANPTNSAGCAADSYTFGQLVSMSAGPAAGWQVLNWGGTANDNSASLNNTFTMPAADHEVKVNYGRSCYTLTLNHTGAGSDPTTNPTNSTGCPTGQYSADQVITLQAAPGTGHTVSGWHGTADDSSAARTNTVTMPAANHSVTVDYALDCYALTLTHVGEGDNPVADLANSQGCAAGFYHFEEPIGLSAAPAIGWQVSAWSGTVNNVLTSTTNSLVMPAVPFTATVHYGQPPVVDVGDIYEQDNTCSRSRVIKSDGSEVQEHSFHVDGDIDWIRFDVSAGSLYRIEATVPTGSKADVVLEPYSSCDGALGSLSNPSFNPGARLEFTRTVSGPTYVRIVNAEDEIAGDDVIYHVSVRKMDEAPTNRALIIVSGRLKKNDPVQPNIDKVAGEVYKAFIENGYSDDDIFVLGNSPDLPGYGGAATLANLEWALTEWAAARGTGGVLNLYMIDHGNPDRFLLDDVNGQVVTPDQLDKWLTTLETKASGVKINVVIEACQSGSFISKPGSISSEGRVIITSSNATASAYTSKTGGIYFSDHFITGLRQGYNLSAAFDDGQRAAAYANIYQQAWIDGDGDGVHNEFGDIVAASQRSFAYPGTLPADVWAPYIFDVAAVGEVSDGNLRLRADVRDDGAVRQVWVVIYPPSYQPPADDQELLPEAQVNQLFVRLDDTHWEVQLSAISELGIYRFVIHADDGNGMVARPYELTIDTASHHLFLPVIMQ